MGHSTTSIQDIIARRVETGLADLLLAVYDSGYCAALGSQIELTAAPQLADLLTMLAARHRCEIQASRGWAPPPIAADDLPGWLLRQSQQADWSVHERAYHERMIALGDTTSE